MARKILHVKARNPGLEPNGVVTPLDKHERIPLDYISCVVQAFKRIKKVSIYHRRIITQKKPGGRSTYKDKMEKGSISHSDSDKVMLTK